MQSTALSLFLSLLWLSCSAIAKPQAGYDQQQDAGFYVTADTGFYQPSSVHYGVTDPNYLGFDLQVRSY